MAKKKAKKTIKKTARKAASTPTPDTSRHLIDPQIGMIGMGWIGMNYYEEFKKRGYNPIGYSLEKPWIENKSKIKECDLVFVAVWTPTTPDGFDSSVLESVLPLVGKGKVAVIKSTIVPGTTKRLQEKFPDITIVYSPEFLSINSAKVDVTNPFANIVGFPIDDAAHRVAARAILNILPIAPFKLVCDSTQAEIIKYSHNVSGVTQILTFNLLYDVAQKLGVGWDDVHAAMIADPFVNTRYAQPVHKSGRGAGGGCFIKDFAAFRERYLELFPEDEIVKSILQNMEKLNIRLLMQTDKDLDLLKGVYGENPKAY